MKTFALRLRPGEDPLAELDSFAQVNHLAATRVLACVGSLSLITVDFGRMSPLTLQQGLAASAASVTERAA
jgi:predicted DNA-binding protein with PD1-like motif